MSNTIGNISTIVKYVSMLIAGWFIGLLASKGLQIPVDEQGLSQCISAIIFLLLAHIDATNPNTIFNTSDCQCNTLEENTIYEDDQQ